VLISPIAVQQADWSTRNIHVALTRDKVKQSPSIDANKPVSRQHERDYYSYYGYPYYWGYSVPWGISTYPAALAMTDRNDALPAERPDETGDVHLRSAKEVRGYHIQGSDDTIGHVEDFIVDDETWQVHYLVIDTSNWWFGKKVLVAPQWASRVSWEEHKVYVNLSQEAIKGSPEWNPNAPVNREYETRLYAYAGRPPYGGVHPPGGTSAPRHSENHPR
jgi:hypothetical protein